MIGDVLTTSILFEALKNANPKAELHYVVNSNTTPVIQNNPFIDKYIQVTPEIEKNKGQFLKFLLQLRHEKYDAVIDVYGKLSSLLISIFAKAKQKISYHKKHTSFFYTTTINRLKNPINNSSLAVENRLKLLEPLGIGFSSLSPKIYLTASEINEAKQFLQKASIQFDKKLYMISVLGSSNNKTYPFEYMAKLLDEVSSHSECQILFNYIPKQEKEAREIYDKCEPKTQKSIFFDVYGKSLRSFLAITHHCDALIGNEGGANNMAKALDIPTFTIFSPYLNKQNWFGEVESQDHVAIHLSDYVNYDEHDKEVAKKDPSSYYLKLKPEYIKSQLNTFLSNLD